MNIIDEIGVLAISTRLQRLAEQIRKDGQLVYALYNIDFEPKWFPVIYSLHARSPLSVVELAAEIGYTHPSTISLLKELEKKGLIRSKRDKEDERKRLLVLTPKGEALVKQMKPVWQDMVTALTAMTETRTNLLRAIEEVEEKIREQSFLQRVQAIKKYK
jgi:DNA-binding MarR family transcriptional regulator